MYQRNIILTVGDVTYYVSYFLYWFFLVINAICMENLVAQHSSVFVPFCVIFTSFLVAHSFSNFIISHSLRDYQYASTNIAFIPQIFQFCFSNRNFCLSVFIIIYSIVIIVYGILLFYYSIILFIFLSVKI